MTIHKERQAREALETLQALRTHAPDAAAFDEAMAVLEEIVGEYGNFDASLVLVYRITSHALDEQDEMRRNGSDLALRLAKAMISITDIRHFSEREQAEYGPPRAPLEVLALES